MNEVERAGAPALSVIAVTRDSVRTLRPITAALAGQSIAAAIELVVVAPTDDASQLDEIAEHTASLHSVQIVGAGIVRNRGHAAAHGVFAARSPIVALTENHCFPEPEWAALTLAAHQDGPWSAVGPAVLNANPEFAISVALHATGYGPFAPGLPPENRLELPLHNSSYRRDVLVAFGDRLCHLLADERRLQAALVDDGHTLRFDPRPRKRHINEATWTLLTGLAWSSGRRYGGARCRDWSLLRRLAYSAAGPLLPLPIMRTARRKLPRDRSEVPAAATWVLLAWASLHAAGEILSYLSGGAPAEFPFVEAEEFLIRERLGNAQLADPAIARLLAELDAPPPRIPA